MNRYHFATNKFIPIPGTCWSNGVSFDGWGDDPESAAQSVKDQIPEGYFIMAWWPIDGRTTCQHEIEEKKRDHQDDV